MVVGMEKFQDKFKDYPGCYTVIGGAACDILMSDVDIDFRATKDIDMILIFEDKYQDFAQVFWEFIKEGGYRCGWKNNDKLHFYRFTKPKEGYPFMIELFSRMPDYHLKGNNGIVPIHIDDDTSSLSAILLNEDFYRFMIEGKKIVHGISVLRAEYLIPFKMYAWLDLRERKSNGEHVDSKDLKKHKYDVFRLLQIISDDEVIETTGMVRESIIRFIDAIIEEDLNLYNIGLSFSREDGLNLIKDLYSV